VAIGVAVLLVAWEALRALDLVSAIILASPSEIVMAAGRSGVEFLRALAITFPTMVVAIALTWVLGVGAGLLCGVVPLLALAFTPIFSSLFAIPLIVWYPMFVIWLGIGPESKVLFAFVSGFFPIALNTISGLQLIDRRFVDVARSFGASRRDILLRVLVPLAFPAVVAGLRVGTGLSVIGVVVAEMLASTGGIGFWISYHRTVFDTGEVYLGIILVLCCVVVINVGLSALERRFGRWRTDQRVVL
jgi:NitT/TauT family transport system permease protein/taurine transport system permease protein